MSLRRASTRVVCFVVWGVIVMRPVRLGAQGAGPPTNAARPVPISLAQEPLTSLPGETEFPLQVTGFGVGDYRYDGRTGDNTFGAGKLAVALFRELSNSVWVFGQLTTSVSSPEEGASSSEGGAVTEIEIDNLIFNVTPAALTSVSLGLGKFDAPIGFERDDEPLNLQATTSFNFEFARPAKMIGFVGRWTGSPRASVTAWVANGWDSAIDTDQGKTVGARVGLLPADGVSVGASVLYGPEPATVGEGTVDRFLVTADYTLQPTSDWIVGGEANYGGNRATAENVAARWYGATATLFRRLTRHTGLTGRAEFFRDRDGARTGTPQTLTSFTVAPLYFIGVGREGIFANIEHTTFRIPRFQVRGEVRFDHSNEAFFDGRDAPVTWTVQYTAQLVATF
jgi:hypothetical protein